MEIIKHLSRRSQKISIHRLFNLLNSSIKILKLENKLKTNKALSQRALKTFKNNRFFNKITKVNFNRYVISSNKIKITLSGNKHRHWFKQELFQLFRYFSSQQFYRTSICSYWEISQKWHIHLHKLFP